jgi:hypothetical protein
MKPTTALLTLAAVAFGLTMSMTAPAQAASRTWVASTGSDSGSCTHAAPCATFSFALGQTDAFGEINCVDAVGNVGNLIIQKSITISCEEGTAGILLAPNSDGIDIDVMATDVVYLKGLDIEGLGPAASGGAGIYFQGGGTLHVEKCRIHGFVSTSVGYGIDFKPGNFSTQSASLFVADTTIADNGATGIGGGILVQPQSSSTVTVSLQRVQLTGNNFGLDADGSNASSLRVAVRDSLASGNRASGFVAETTGGTTRMMIQNSEASNNGTNGIKVDGSNAELFVGGSAIFSNDSAVTVKNSALVFSYQNNQIDGNAANDIPVPAQTLH